MEIHAVNQKLLALRIHYGLSVSKLASISGFAPEEINAWESGTPIPANALITFASLYKVNLDYFMDNRQAELSRQIKLKKRSERSTLPQRALIIVQLSIYIASLVWLFFEFATLDSIRQIHGVHAHLPISYRGWELLFTRISGWQGLVLNIAIIFSVIISLCSIGFGLPKLFCHKPIFYSLNSVLKCLFYLNMFSFVSLGISIGLFFDGFGIFGFAYPFFILTAGVLYFPFFGIGKTFVLFPEFI